MLLIRLSVDAERGSLKSTSFVGVYFCEVEKSPRGDKFFIVLGELYQVVGKLRMDFRHLE
jgi:hypothetical protein